MTGKQLQTMLIFEGLYLTLLAFLLSLLLSALLGACSSHAIAQLLRFFTYHFTMVPLLVVLPVFLLLGTLTPMAIYRSVAKSTIFERLREAEN